MAAEDPNMLVTNSSDIDRYFKGVVLPVYAPALPLLKGARAGHDVLPRFLARGTYLNSLSTSLRLTSSMREKRRIRPTICAYSMNLSGGLRPTTIS